MKTNTTDYTSSFMSENFHATIFFTDTGTGIYLEAPNAEDLKTQINERIEHNKNADEIFGKEFEVFGFKHNGKFKITKKYKMKVFEFIGMIV